jgi:hypothetical protein
VGSGQVSVLVAQGNILGGFHRRHWDSRCHLNFAATGSDVVPTDVSAVQVASDPAGVFTQPIQHATSADTLVDPDAGGIRNGLPGDPLRGLFERDERPGRSRRLGISDRDRTGQDGDDDRLSLSRAAAATRRCFGTRPRWGFVPHRSSLHGPAIDHLSGDRHARRSWRTETVAKRRLRTPFFVTDLRLTPRLGVATYGAASLP